MGILDPLPRTPHVFEEQLKWPLEKLPLGGLASPGYPTTARWRSTLTSLGKSSRRTSAKASWLR